MPIDGILIIPFVFGAVVGSFLNVCIYRIPKGLSIVSPPSSCPSCGSRIPFYLNVSIIAYLALRGRWANCSEPFSPRYPVVEALTGLFAVFAFMRFGPSIETLVYFAFLSALIVITFIDLDLKIIPDVISIPGIVIGLGLSFFLPYPGVADSFIGALIGALLILAFGKGGRYAIPFGPFLALGATVHLFFGEAMIAWYIAKARGL